MACLWNLKHPSNEFQVWIRSGWLHMRRPLNNHLKREKMGLIRMNRGCFWVSAMISFFTESKISRRRRQWVILADLLDKLIFLVISGDGEVAILNCTFRKTQLHPRSKFYHPFSPHVSKICYPSKCSSRYAKWGRRCRRWDKWLYHSTTTLSMFYLVL
jgi:hypothetical protein